MLTKDMVYILLHKSVQHDNLGYVKYKRHEFDNEIEIVAKALMITSGHNTGHKFFTRLGNR